MNMPKTELERALGYKSLNRLWAKAEILLGLAGAGAGLFVGKWAISATMIDPVRTSMGVLMGLLLFVLGGYLTLAGHRSHLYQSNNELTAYLAEEIRRSQTKG